MIQVKLFSACQNDQINLETKINDYIIKLPPNVKVIDVKYAVSIISSCRTECLSGQFCNCIEKSAMIIIEL